MPSDSLQKFFEQQQRRVKRNLAKVEERVHAKLALIEQDSVARHNATLQKQDHDAVEIRDGIQQKQLSIE